MNSLPALPVERTPQQQAARWKTIVISVCAVVLGLVVAPVIFTAIAGLVACND